MNFVLFGLLLFLAGCENKLDKLTQAEVYDEANKHFDNKNYGSAVRFFEHYEAKYPLSNNIKDSMYKRAMSYYNRGEYAFAIVAFEAFIYKYPTDERIVKIHRNIFFCYYNQMTRYDRDYELIEKAIESSVNYQECYVEDPIFQEALKRLDEFFIFHKLNQIHRAIENDPKLWISVLWNASDIVKNKGNHKFAAEAYYRLIEFLVAQKSESIKQDAIAIFEQMSKYHSDSEWFIQAQKKIESIDLIMIEEEMNEDQYQEDFIENSKPLTIKDEIKAMSH
jgi:outer membrane protein assembly factor BamD (BamD/ComL family)